MVPNGSGIVQCIPFSRNSEAWVSPLKIRRYLFVLPIGLQNAS
ncbi:hypothetical protein AWB81_07307 [Caballeronia arationis]|nr:hypothetical protein AWB81_07307 [Caballeronia arationis]